MGPLSTTITNPPYPELISGVAHERSGPISDCPVCGYCLRGLPREYRCPECGFQYDDSTRVWRERGRGRFAGLSVVLFALLAVGYLYSASLFNPDSPKLVLGRVVIALVGLAALRNLRPFFHRAYVAVVPEGIRLSVKKSDDVLIRWDGLDGVEVREVGQRAFVKVAAKGRRRRLDVSGVLHNPGAARAFSRAVERRLASRNGHVRPLRRVPSDTPISWQRLTAT